MRQKLELVLLEQDYNPAAARPIAGEDIVKVLRRNVLQPYRLGGPADSLSGVLLIDAPTTVFYRTGRWKRVEFWNMGDSHVSFPSLQFGRSFQGYVEAFSPDALCGKDRRVLNVMVNNRDKVAVQRSGADFSVMVRNYDTTHKELSAYCQELTVYGKGDVLFIPRMHECDALPRFWKSFGELTDLGLERCQSSEYELVRYDAIDAQTGTKLTFTNRLIGATHNIRFSAPEPLSKQQFSTLAGQYMVPESLYHEKWALADKTRTYEVSASKTAGAAERMVLFLSKLLHRKIPLR